MYRIIKGGEVGPGINNIYGTHRASVRRRRRFALDAHSQQSVPSIASLDKSWKYFTKEEGAEI